jgi:hypothetical protein
VDGEVRISWIYSVRRRRRSRRGERGGERKNRGEQSGVKLRASQR